MADPVREYVAAADRVMAAFAAAGVLGAEFVLPEISPKLRFPAAEAIGFHLVDYVVHGWDVARALGRGYDLEPPAAARWTRSWPCSAGGRSGPRVTVELWALTGSTR